MFLIQVARDVPKLRLQPRHTLTQLILGVVVATVSATLFNVLWGGPDNDTVVLLGLMVFTGLVSVGLGYLLYHRRIIRQMNSLQASLIVNATTTSLILTVNIVVVALYMLVTELDSLMITTLLIYGGILSVIFSVLHSRLIIEELHSLHQALEQMDVEDGPEQRLSVSGKDEISQLLAVFNHTTRRLHEAQREKQAVEQSRRDFIAWTSHDLRTPLTALQVMTEALMDEMVSDVERKGYLEDMHREILSLSRLIDDMFELSLIESGHHVLKLQRTSLRDLLSAVESSYRLRATQAEICFETRISKDIDPIVIDPDKIQRVLNNFIDNAFQYTNADGRIELAAMRRDNDEVIIAIFNSGSVINEAEIPFVFDQFYRGDRSRNSPDRQKRHVGLGLAIAQRFVEAHGGRTWIESGGACGTTFYFSLPYGERSTAHPSDV